MTALAFRSLRSLSVWTFVSFAGVTLTLLYAAGAAVTVGQAFENACYPLPELVESEDIAGEYGKAEASLLPLGVRCTFRGQDGSVAATTLEPGPVFGWTVTALAVLSVVALLFAALLVAGRARERGLGPSASRMLGVLVFLTPPLGALAAVAVRSRRAGSEPVQRLSGSCLAKAGTVSIWGGGILATLILAGILSIAFETERVNSLGCSVPFSAANQQWPEGSEPPTGRAGTLTVETEDSFLPFVKRCIFTDPDSGELLGANRTGFGPLASLVYLTVIVSGFVLLVAVRTGRPLYAAVTLLAPPLGVLLAASRRPD